MSEEWPHMWRVEPRDLDAERWVCRCGVASPWRANDRPHAWSEMRNEIAAHLIETGQVSLAQVGAEPWRGGASLDQVFAFREPSDPDSEVENRRDVRRYHHIGASPTDATAAQFEVAIRRVTKKESTIASIRGVRFVSGARPNTREERDLLSVQTALAMDHAYAGDEGPVVELQDAEAGDAPGKRQAIVTLWVPKSLEAWAVRLLSEKGFTIA